MQSRGTGIAASGNTSFTWSVTSAPKGAEIYISRLGMEEIKWAGKTDLTDQRLEFAIWTFRFEWNGCSKTEKPDPYLQAKVTMSVTKEGCRKNATGKL